MLPPGGHAKKHGINSAKDHKPMPGATVDHIVTVDLNGLPKDSGTSISAILGGLIYQGTWDASTNTPTLADGTGTQGHFYAVSVAGDQDLGHGTVHFDIGDWVLYDGSIWDKVDHTDLVVSVDGRTGAVTLSDLYAALSHSHSSHTDLNWAASGHTIDTDLDMDGNDITDVAQIVGDGSNPTGIESSDDISLKLGDNVGANKVKILDSGDTEVAAIDSDGNITTLGSVDGTDISAHVADADAHHAKSHAHDGADGSGTVSHSNLTGVSANQHHNAVEVYNAAGTKQSDEQKIVPHSFAYTNGGDAINLVALTDATVTPKITFGVRYNTLTYDSRHHFTPVVTSLTHNGTYWVAIIRCNKIYYGSGPPGFYFVECATNDVYIDMIAEGE